MSRYKDIVGERRNIPVEFKDKIAIKHGFKSFEDAELTALSRKFMAVIVEIKEEFTKLKIK